MGYKINQKNFAKKFMQIKTEIIKLKKILQSELVSEETKEEIGKLILTKEKHTKEQQIRDDFLSFAKHMWPEFIQGPHHKIIAQKFNDIANSKSNRIIVNMPPRHTKSEFASSLLPAWMIGRNPKLKIIQTTHTGELAIRFGRKAKTLQDSPEYKEVFETRLREDSQAAGRWETAQGG